MSSIDSILNAGRTALLANQKAIDVASNNIANVNTPGYTRQRPVFRSLGATLTAGGTSAAGVHITDVRRAYDRFLSAQLNTEKQAMGRWEAQQGGLERAEIIFTEAEDFGLSHVMSEFWNAWQDLSNNPAGHIERVAVVGKAQQLSMTFNQMAHELSQLRTDMNSSIKGVIDEVNWLSEQIAGLNAKIKEVEAGGVTANEMRDTRDQMLQDLSQLIDLSAYEKDDGSLSVIIGTGQPLIENVAAHRLSTAPSGVPGQLDRILLQDSFGATQDITDQIGGGKLKGYLEVRDTFIPDYQTRLDTLAASIIGEVNGLHSLGLALDGSQNPFFTGSGAVDIAVDPTIANDANKIAAAGPTDGLPGGNSTAMAIANLQHQLTMSGNGTTFGEFYHTLVSGVGNDVQNADNYYQHQEQMVLQLDNYWEAASGVSIDEEMVDLIKYQYAYEAAARVIRAADELMETLISIV
jgi:flagellar hook-associated protein 1 FlgK